MNEIERDVPYDRAYYLGRHRNTIYAATSITAIVLSMLPPIESAIDVGCGVGTWLSVLKDKGIGYINGIDGNWIDKELLSIPEENFQQADLSCVVQEKRRYDLAISLEVAEHLSEENASQFVRSLTGLSDFILFSAAIPLQGGNNHLNERWPSYWANLFSQVDYQVHDFIRPKIWNDQKIPFWYRQNCFLYSHRSRSHEIHVNAAELTLLDVVHPELWHLRNTGPMYSK